MRKKLEELHYKYMKFADDHPVLHKTIIIFGPSAVCFSYLKLQEMEKDRQKLHAESTEAVELLRAMWDSHPVNNPPEIQ